MNNGKELQNNDIYLPGGIGTVKIGENKAEIIQEFRSNDGSVTLTLLPITISQKKIDDHTIQITCERLIKSVTIK